MINKKSGNIKSRMMEKIAIIASYSALIALFLCAILRVNFYAFPMFADTDMYLDTLVAKLMWEQKTLFPENWIFGNQYYVVATPVLCSLLYGLTHDLNTAMGLASSIMGILVLVSFVWMIWPFTKNKINVLAGVLVMMASLICKTPYKDYLSQLFYVMCSYYSCYLITAFLVWGQYIRMKDSIDQISVLKIGIILLCVVLSFCTGMQSIRQTIVMVIPMCAWEGICCFLQWLKKEQISKSVILFVIWIAIANGCGILFIKCLNIPQHVIYGEMKLIDSGQTLLSNAKIIWMVWKALFGIGETTSRWILGIRGIMCAVVIFVIAFLLLRTAYRRERVRGIASLIFLCTFSFGVVIGGKLISTMALRTVYLFMWYPLVCLSVVYILERCEKLWYTFGIVVVFLLAIKSYTMTYGSLQQELDDQDYRYQESVEVASWMEEKGYHIVYGAWNLASDIAMASNGDVVATCWPYESEEDIFAIAPWIVDTNTLLTECNDVAIYIVRNENEHFLVERANQMGVEVCREKICEAYTIYTADKLLIYPDEAILDE